MTDAVQLLPCKHGLSGFGCMRCYRDLVAAEEERDRLRSALGRLAEPDKWVDDVCDGSYDNVDDVIFAVQKTLREISAIAARALEGKVR
jgi:hypothetical protein